MSYEFEDYDEEPTQEELEEFEGAEATVAKMTAKKLKIEFDTENFVLGIVGAVASEVKKNLYKEIINEIKKDILDDMREKIKLSVNDIVKDIVVDFMENEKITIGGNGIWDDEPKQEMSLMQYSKKCIRECIEASRFKVVTSIEKDRYSSSGYKTKTAEFTFDQYIQSKLGIGNEAKAYFDKEIDKVRTQVNKDVKNAFDESTKTMLSQTVLNVLMANDTYKKIESNIANIANK